jgi:hypothetical protein
MEISIPQIEKLKTLWATPIGIEENDLIARIWPNPATDVIIVEFKGYEKVESISLISPEGKEIKNTKIGKSIDRVQVSVSEFQAGIYFLRIILSDGRVVSRKVIVK